MDNRDIYEREAWLLQRASGQDISDEAINGVKSGLMGPLAGLGDSITQGLITPILLALGISLAMEGNLAGPILYFILQAGAIIGLSYALWFGGYRWGRSMVDRLLAGGLLSRVTEAAGVLGMGVLGALAARQVSLSTVAQVTSGQQTVALQGDVLDTMMKGILPLLLTLGLWWLLSRRVSPMVIIGMIFVAGIDGVLLGWLGWAPSTVTWWSALGLAITVGLWWALLSPRVKPLHAAALLAIYWAFMLIWGRWNLSMFAGLATWAWAWWQAAGKPSASDETPA